MKQSAGTLLYRRGAGGLEVLLVHASGNYNKKAPWGVPKGLPDEGEELEAAARRETLEETGVEVSGGLTSLGHIDYTRSRKRVHCWAGPIGDDVEPRCASWEVDSAEFMPISRAKQLIHPEQSVFLDRLEALLTAPAQAE